MKAIFQLLLISILFTLRSSAQAQTERDVYSLVMDSLYRSTTTTDTASASVISGGPHFAYIDRYVARRTELTARRRYVDYFEGKWQGTTESRLKDLSVMQFGKNKYCLRIIGNQETVPYTKTKRCTIGKSSNELPVARYTLSRILYVNNKRTGLLLIRQQWGNGAGSSKVWAIILTKNAAGWQIDKMNSVTE